MSVVKIGIIGCGGIFHLMHFKVIKKLRDKFEITAVYDPDKNAYKNNSILINKASVNYNSFIKNPNVDVIFILTPISTHLRITLDSLNNKKHVFLEKPAAVSVKEIKKIISASVNHKKHVQVGMVLRHSKWYYALKKIIKSGKYGRLLWMHWLETRPFDPMNWRYDSKSGNGDAIIHDKAVHQVNLFNAFAEAKPLKVSALGGQYMLSNKKSGKLHAFNEKVSLKGDSNDHLMCLIEYRNGVKADLLISYVSAHTRESRWVIQLEDAKIITHFETYVNGINKFQWGTCPSCIYLFKDNKKYSVPWKIPMSYPPSEQNLVFYDEYKNDPLHPGSTRQLREFHKSITENIRPDCSLSVALEDARVIEAINKSIKTNRVVYV